MSERSFQNLSSQVAETLREGMAGGRWRGTLPGRDRLAGTLGVSHKTVEAAMRQLAAEGWLISEGAGRRRRIVLPKGRAVKRTLRVRVLLYEDTDRALPFHMELLSRLQKAGFAAEYAIKSLHDLGMDAGRVATFVRKTPADVWIVSGGSREILEWFTEQPIPMFALFGRFSGLPIAASSPRKTPAMNEAVEKLVALGHRRIVMLAREERRKPDPGLFERNFLATLERLGVATGPYNLPDWEETAAGLRAGLEMLFRHSHPSALLIGDAPLFIPVQQFLARREIKVPGQVSLFCLDPDPAYEWCVPVISHIRWDFARLVRRVVRWVETIAHGKEDKRQVLFDAEFFEGGTIGKVV